MSAKPYLIEPEYDEFNALLRAAGEVAKRKGLPCTITPEEVRAELLLRSTGKTLFLSKPFAARSSVGACTR